MKKYRAAWWSERVAELASGGEVRAIAERYGVKERTLIWWRAELGRRGDPRLLPVAMSLKPQSAGGVGSNALEVVVELGSARVTLHGSVSCEQLTALVAAARAC